MQNSMIDDFDVLAKSQEFAEFTRIIKNLTGLAMAINTPDVTKIHSSLKSNEGSSLCKLIQSMPEGLKRCHACDQKFHRRAIVLGRPLCYTCHAGLTDMCIPIILQGTHVATISCGQILLERPGNAGAKKIIKRLDWLDIPPKQLRDAYFGAPYMPKHSVKYVMLLLSFFAQHLCENARKLKEFSNLSVRYDIRTAQKYIEKNFRNGQLQLIEVARIARLSPAYFCSVYRKVIGVHYSSYLRNLRVNESKRLLSITGKSITNICYNCGFNSLTHFNRVFRQSEHCSPSQYRKRILKESNIR